MSNFIRKFSARSPSTDTVIENTTSMQSEVPMAMIRKFTSNAVIADSEIHEPGATGNEVALGAFQ